MKIFDGIKKSRIFFPEDRDHIIPAVTQPVESNMKYKARAAETSGYEDQSEVIRNQTPGRRRKLNG